MAKNINIARNISQAFEKVKKEERWAVADSLTEVGKEAVAALEQEVQRIFDRPTNYVVKSFYSTRANERKLKIRVGIKDFAGKGKNTGVAILGPHIEGGSRGVKRMEFWLREKGILKPSEFVVPGKGIKLNKYGNISGSQITKILSGVQVFDSGLRMNETRESRKRKKNPESYLVVRSGSITHLHPGIYQRKSTKLNPLLIFIKSPSYQKVFEFEKIVTDVFNKRFPKEVREQIARRIN